MRDLDAALPRVEVADYRWTDDGFELCITLPLGEPVPREQARGVSPAVPQASRVEPRTKEPSRHAWQQLPRPHLGRRWKVGIGWAELRLWARSLAAL